MEESREALLARLAQMGHIYHRARLLRGIESALCREALDRCMALQEELVAKHGMDEVQLERTWYPPKEEPRMRNPP